MGIGLMCVFLTNTEIMACVQWPLPLRKTSVHRLLRLLNWYVELTSVKKGLSLFPFFYICTSQ